MIVNAANVSALTSGFSTLFNGGLADAISHYKCVAMVVPSSNREETYVWLGQMAPPREWVGPRVVKNLSLHNYSIKNKLFESSVSIQRIDIEDDRVGVFGPVFSEMGKAAGEEPDRLIFSLLKEGFAGECYDGQNFFDTDHPVFSAGSDQPVASVSNMQSGDGPAWFLLDTSRALKPMIYQERIKVEFQRQDNANTDEKVFTNDEFRYGTRFRSNAGYGLWQLAFGSKAELTAENYEAARAAMMGFVGDEGRPLGIRPDVLVAPPSLEGAAMRLLNNGDRIVLVGEDDMPVAVQNEWAKTAEPIVTPWVA